MITVPINQPELGSIEFMRVALSEANQRERLLAIKSVKLDIETALLEKMTKELDTDWMLDPNNANFVRWVAATSSERREAGFDLFEIGRRYQTKNERKLNIAEHIGFQIWLSVRDGRFAGLHTAGGILEQVSDAARCSEVTGAKDRDTLRKIWKSYKGVAHLGMACSYCEDNPDQGINVLHLAEQFRRSLSENCPKGTSKPYVDRTLQISFLYLSKTSGPRFRDRGLPFGVD